MELRPDCDEFPGRSGVIGLTVTTRALKRESGLALTPAYGGGTLTAPFVRALCAIGSVAFVRVFDAFGRGVSLPDPPFEAPTLGGGKGE